MNAMHEISPTVRDGAVLPAGRTRQRTPLYETRVVTIPAGVSRGEARQYLADEAEYGKWELARVQLFRGGLRKVWLRRRVMRVVASTGRASID